MHPCTKRKRMKQSKTNGIMSAKRTFPHIVQNFEWKINLKIDRFFNEKRFFLGANETNWIDYFWNVWVCPAETKRIGCLTLAFLIVRSFWSYHTRPQNGPKTPEIFDFWIDYYTFPMQNAVVCGKVKDKSTLAQSFR